MAVCLPDTSCLIHLERIERLDMLRALYDDIRIPPGMRDEFGRVPDGIDVVPAPNVALIRLLRCTVDAGEAELIALGTETEDPHVILDDNAARREARSSLDLPAEEGMLSPTPMQRSPTQQVLDATAQHHVVEQVEHAQAKDRGDGPDEYGHDGTGAQDGVDPHGPKRDRSGVAHDAWGGVGHAHKPMPAPAGVSLLASLLVVLTDPLPRLLRLMDRSGAVPHSVRIRLRSSAVVSCPCVRVRQRIVGSAYRDKLLVGLRVAPAVGMCLKRTLPVGFFDLVRRRVELDAKHLVVVSHRQQEAAGEVQECAR